MSGDWLPPVDTPAPRAQAPAITNTAHYLSRVGAAAVDLVVRLAIALVVLLLVMAGGASVQQALDITVIAGGLIGLAYAPIMIAITGGQTVGHQATGTKIVRQDGTPLDGSGALIREVAVKSVLFEGLGALLVFIPTLANYLWPLWDERDEALHDKLCKTRVVDV